MSGNEGGGQVPNLKELHCVKHSYFTRAVVRGDIREQSPLSCQRGLTKHNVCFWVYGGWACIYNFVMPAF